MTVPVWLLWYSLCGTGISICCYGFPPCSVSLDAKTDENCVLTPPTTSYVCVCPILLEAFKVGHNKELLSIDVSLTVALHPILE